MRIQNSRIKIKTSSTTGEVPTVAPSGAHTDGSWNALDIYKGELFINLVDGKIFSRDDSGIFEVYTTNSGDYFKQGGNAFGATAVVGTTDNNDLYFLTNNTNKGAILKTGEFVFGAVAKFTDTYLSILSNANTAGTYALRIRNSDNNDGYLFDNAGQARFPGSLAVGTSNAAPAGSTLYVQGACVHIGNSALILGSQEALEIVPAMGNASYLLSRSSTTFVCSADFITGGNTGTGWSTQLKGTSGIYAIYDRVNALDRLTIENNGLITAQTSGGDFNKIAGKWLVFSADETATQDYVNFEYTGAGGDTLTLYSAGGWRGTTLCIMKPAGVTLDIEVSGGETIDGNVTTTLGMLDRAINLKSNGVNWIIT